MPAAARAPAVATSGAAFRPAPAPWARRTARSAPAPPASKSQFRGSITATRRERCRKTAPRRNMLRSVTGGSSASPLEDPAGQELLGPLQLVGDRLGLRPAVALAFVDVVLDRAAGPADGVDEGIGLGLGHRLVPVALEDEQRHGDRPGVVDRGAVAVEAGGLRQGADHLVEVAGLVAVGGL